MQWPLLAIGAGAYAAAIIAMAPATLADAGLERASNGRLRLIEAQGTLWSGSARIEIRDQALRSGFARGIAWRVLPESLLRGRLVCELALEPASRHFPVTLSWSQIELANVELGLPATVLGLAVPRLAPLGLTGDMLIHVAGLSIARDSVSGSATLQWRTAGSTLTPVAPLGDYELGLIAEGTIVRAVLRTIEGPLVLEGAGSWSRGRSPVLQATAGVPEQYRQQLAPLLRLIAIERGEGRFELQLK